MATPYSDKKLLILNRVVLSFESVYIWFYANLIGMLLLVRLLSGSVLIDLVYRSHSLNIMFLHHFGHIFNNSFQLNLGQCHCTVVGCCFLAYTILILLCNLLLCTSMYLNLSEPCLVCSDKLRNKIYFGPFVELFLNFRMIYVFWQALNC